MLILLGAIINQKPVQTSRRYVNWNQILSVSDYQNVVNLVYLGILGLEKEISEACGEEFYQKYKRELLLYESYQKAEEVILWQLERHGIDALLLSDTSVRELYPLPEMASFGQIEILVDKKNLAQIYRLMRDMDYEQVDDRLEKGNVYVRVPGIRVVFYGEIPIENKVLKRYFSGPIRKYLRMEYYSQGSAPRRGVLQSVGAASSKYRFIHILSDEEEYVYRAGRLVELYLTGVLKIRNILEFWLFRKGLDEAFPWKAVRDLLEKAKWTEFVHQAEVLSSLWFEEGVRQQYGIALELEEYILLRGQDNKHLDKVLLPDEKARLDFYRRDREEEWLLKKREWMFPPKDYMCQFFPILDKYPFLLIFCWGIRNVRIYYRMCAARCEKAWLRLSVKCLDIKEQMKARFAKKENAPEELPPGNEEAVREPPSGNGEAVREPPSGNGEAVREPPSGNGEAAEELLSADSGAAEEKETASDADQGSTEPELTEGDGQVEEFKD